MAILVQAILPEMTCAWILQAGAHILNHGIIRESFFLPVLLSYDEEETLTG